MRLGIIADDFTGATDIASFLVENGMRTIQINGIPTEKLNTEIDAVVISLKSRSCPKNEAIEMSKQALRWLKFSGCKQFYFKYCSTFDSSRDGNIGPVTDVLLDELNSDFTIICPALPVNGRTVFNGHLFVLGQLLSESGMRNHPVTPMTNSNIMQLMDAQAEGKTGLVNYECIEKGANEVKKHFKKLKDLGIKYCVVDAFTENHLSIISKATNDFKLITGGSGLAAYIAQQYSKSSPLINESYSVITPVNSKTVILSGSCSEMTNKQVNSYKSKAPHIAIEVDKCMQSEDDLKEYTDSILTWYEQNSQQAFAPLIYATSDSSTLQNIQKTYGAEKASQAVERFFSLLSIKLKTYGVKNFIVAGGETSGVVTQSLKVTSFHIGPKIAPGVPWVKSTNEDLFLALKSGNFGDESFFINAQEFFL